MLAIGVIFSIVLLVVVLLPFSLGGEEQLLSAALTDSTERLHAEKKAILNRYLEDESAFERKVINKIMWQQRRQYLVNRYIDAARRLDYLEHIANETPKTSGEADEKGV